MSTPPPTHSAEMPAWLRLAIQARTLRTEMRGDALNAVRNIKFSQ